MTQIMRKTILVCLASFLRVTEYLAHPEPGFGQDLIGRGHIDGPIQIVTCTFLAAGFRIYDPIAQQFLAIFVDHPRTTASVILDTRTISFTSCTRIISAPRVMPTATVAAV